jgi:hypothetical protein
MEAARYHLRSSDEDRKQLYWGAFMLGCAAFHQHRRAGYWLDDRAVGRLALARFHALLTTDASCGVACYVDDEDLGRVCFCCAFLAGYRQRLLRCGTDGIVLRRVPPVQRAAAGR